MNAAPLPTVAAEINRLHEFAQRLSAESRQNLDGALAAAWQAGQLLIAEKKRVRHSMGAGAWLLWLEANFRGTPRTAQRYMKLARSVADVSFLRELSLRQAYARLGIATEPKPHGSAPLRHRLPVHLVLANRLLRELKRAPVVISRAVRAVETLAKFGHAPAVNQHQRGGSSQSTEPGVEVRKPEVAGAGLGRTTERGFELAVPIGLRKLGNVTLKISKSGGAEAVEILAGVGESGL